MLYFLMASQATGLELVALILAFILAIAVGMSAHEYAHARTAFARGDDTAKLAGRMTINPISHITPMGLICFVLFGFGWAKPVPINPTRFRNYKKDATWVMISGILTNLGLALVFSGLWFFLAPMMLASGNVLLFFLAYFIQFAFIINLSLAVFNLLPVPPLDGFNILALWTKYDNKFVQFLSQYGLILLIIFILPIFGGQSILGLFYDNVLLLFALFWGLFL